MSKISIILPTYNVEQYIARAIESCINQTFKNIEIIVVDDCGSDKSIDIAKEYAKKDDRIKIIHNEENDVKIAIEYCRSSGGKTMAIGSASTMIDKGAWQTDKQPHLPKSYKEYEVLFRFGFQYKGFRFLCEYLNDKKESIPPIWFIRPYPREFYENLIVFSDEVKVSPYWQRDIYNISIENEKLKQLFQKFKENKIFYANDMTGTDFKQSIDFMIRK